MSISKGMNADKKTAIHLPTTPSVLQIVDYKSSYVNASIHQFLTKQTNLLCRVLQYLNALGLKFETPVLEIFPVYWVYSGSWRRRKLILGNLLRNIEKNLRDSADSFRDPIYQQKPPPPTNQSDFQIDLDHKVRRESFDQQVAEELLVGSRVERILSSRSFPAPPEKEPNAAQTAVPGRPAGPCYGPGATYDARAHAVDIPLSGVKILITPLL